MLALILKAIYRQYLRAALSLDGDACHAVIKALIDASFLRWTPAGRHPG